MSFCNLSDVHFPRNWYKTVSKELSLWNKIRYLSINIFRTQCCKPLKFQTQIIKSNRIHSLKYLRSSIFGPKDIVIRKSEFVAKTQFLYTKIYLNLKRTLYKNIWKCIKIVGLNLGLLILLLFERQCSIIITTIGGISGHVRGTYINNIINWKIIKFKY